MCERADEAKEAFYDGRAAFRARLPRSSNPDVLGTLEGRCWDDGWQSALQSAVWLPEWLRPYLMFADSPIFSRAA